MPSRPNHLRLQTRLLAVAMWLGLLGALMPALINDGGSMARYVARQMQLQIVADDTVEDYFGAVLYGEGKVPDAAPTLADVSERGEDVSGLFRVDRWFAMILLFAASLLLVPVLLERTPLHHGLLVISLWLLADALGETLNGGKAHSGLAMFAHASRWGLPLMLWAMVRHLRRGEQEIRRSCAWVRFAVLCTALTFASHGWEALRLHPAFQDLIHGFARLFGLEMPPAVAAAHLRVIGVMDLALAVIILCCRRSGIFLWMACWGMITALSRPLTLGIDAWPEAAMRVANFSLPLMIWMLYRRAGDAGSGDPTLKPAHEIL